jgi:hypothetical protein
MASVRPAQRLVQRPSALHGLQLARPGDAAPQLLRGKSSRVMKSRLPAWRSCPGTASALMTPATRSTSSSASASRHGQRRQQAHHVVPGDVDEHAGVQPAATRSPQGSFISMPIIRPHAAHFAHPVAAFQALAQAV